MWEINVRISKQKYSGSLTTNFIMTCPNQNYWFSDCYSPMRQHTNSTPPLISKVKPWILNLKSNQYLNIL